jgi:hypothetical protein
MRHEFPLRYIDPQFTAEFKKAGVMPSSSGYRATTPDVYSFWSDDVVEKISWETFAAIKKQASKEMNARTEAGVKEFPSAGKIYREAKDLERASKSLFQVRTALKGNDFDPTNVLVYDLKGLVQTMKEAVEKTSTHKWVFMQLHDDFLFTAAYVDEIEYTPASRGNDEYVSISLVCASGKESPSFCEETVNIYASSVFGRKAKFLADSGRDDEGFDDDDDGETEDNSGKVRVKKIQDATKRSGGVKLSVILERKGLFLQTDTLLAEYEKSVAAYRLVADKCGEQFVAENTEVDGYLIDNSDRYNSGIASLTIDGVLSKLIIDDVDAEDYDSGFDRASGFSLHKDVAFSQSFWNQKTPPVVPTIPIVRAFNLDHDAFCFVAADSIVPYSYDDKIWDKLILPESDLDFVQMLLSSTSVNISDIVKGKARGIITICSGPAGLGKTLTAEASSEAFHKPFYSVQCSQLGVDPEELEKNLKLALGRAARWEAILLLDEADVYVRRRGVDINHNAIVGVFLRVLEYYRGVMFMTTNLGHDIDDAILSRATAHLQYSLPTLENLPKLWRTLATQLTVNLTDKDFDDLIEHFGSVPGRSIRNLLKLTKYYAVSKKAKPTAAMVKQVSAYLNVDVLAQRAAEAKKV